MLLKRKKLEMANETGRTPPIGYAQRRFLKLLTRLGPNEEPDPKVFSARGVMRDRVANDCVGSHLATIEQLEDGGNKYMITPLGRKALKSNKTNKAPPKGYRKVPRRTAERILGAAALNGAAAHGAGKA